MQNTKITILMATYNGSKYIEQQLDSIINQTYENWELWIRDDLSTDSTIEIINKYVKKDLRIHLYKDNLENLGSVMNFSTLLSNVALHNYVMFSDQDDIWLPIKIEVTLKRMLEQEKGNSNPILIYSLLTLVDNSLNTINMKRYNLPTHIKINDIIAQNFIYGCTMMLNKELFDLCTPISDQAENHDYWIALIAANYGSIYLVEQPLILYRQHDNNVSGSYKNSLFSYRLKRILNNNYENQLTAKLLMYDALVKHLNSLNMNTDFFQKYISIFKKNRFYRLYFITKYKIYKHGSGNMATIMHYVSLFLYLNYDRKIK
jgi:glycosyltransferase involved in cell wall biosynthesis